MSKQVHTSRTTDDYLMSMYAMMRDNLTIVGARLAERLKVSPGAVTQALQRMQRQGLIRSNAKREVSLTPEGKAIAATVIRHHFLTERFLVDTLGVGWAVVHEEAGDFGLSLSPLTEEKLTSFLGHPDTCPHGNPIPGTESKERLGCPLTQIKEGEEVRILRVVEEAEEDLKLMRYLWDQKLIPGKRLKVVELSPSLGATTVRMDGRDLALTTQVASALRVSLKGTK